MDNLPPSFRILVHSVEHPPLQSPFILMTGMLMTSLNPCKTKGPSSTEMGDLVLPLYLKLKTNQSFDLICPSPSSFPILLLSSII